MGRKEESNTYQTHRDAKRSQAHSYTPTDADLFFLQPSSAKRFFFFSYIKRRTQRGESGADWRYYEMKEKRSTTHQRPPIWILPFRILSKRIETLLKSSCVCWT